MAALSNPNTEHFHIARQSMIDSQIHPMGVVLESVLEAFATVPREAFVPPEKQGVCYCDEDIQIAKGRYMLEPAVLARMIQGLQPKAEQVALTIGSGAGYDAAVLSQIVTTVVALDQEDDFLNYAQASWNELSYCNIVGAIGPHIEGAPVNAPYDIILFNGAVAYIPEDIKRQLNIGGRLIAPVKPAGRNIAKVTVVERVKEDVFSETILFDSGTPYLIGFEPAKEFVF